MSDEDQLIRCPSCNHENAPYVDKCIICDFPLARYVNQPQTRQMNRSRITDDDLVPQKNKKLGPLPDSDMLADKKKRTQSAPQTLQCPKCGENSRMGTVMCSNCGERLDVLHPLNQNGIVSEDTEEALPTIPDAHDTKTQSVSDNLERIRKQVAETPAVRRSDPSDNNTMEIPSGCVKFSSWMMLQLNVRGDSEPLVVQPIEDNPLIIGRRHESLDIQPHIDLTPYLVNKHGVSRHHAVLRLNGTRLELLDLKSTNGTSINGTRFAPKECHQLRHQDVIQIGQIQIQINFIKQVESVSSGHTEELS
jgi:hypothetical protein